jgi:hypothetical protein
VPDLVAERCLLRDQQRDGDQQARGALNHGYFARTASVRR